MICSEKGIQSVINSLEPKQLKKDMYGNVSEKFDYTSMIKETTDFRLTPAQLKEKIAKLEARAEKNPEDAEDIKADIAELKACLARKLKEQVDYSSTLDRMSKVK